MAKARLVEIELKDSELRRLERKIGKTIDRFQKPTPLKRAVHAGTKRHAQNLKKVVPVVTGTLKKSIGRRAKMYKSHGVVVAIAGPRCYGKFQGYHGHLVELGFTHKGGTSVPGRLIFQDRFNTDKGLILRDTMANLKTHLKKALK